MLVVDETGDVKKGADTVGVQHQHQHTGTAGRIENSRVAVHLVYADERGHAAVDRELYIPRSWKCPSGLLSGSPKPRTALEGLGIRSPLGPRGGLFRWTRRR